MKQVRNGLLVLLIAIFAMAGAALASGYTYLGGNDYSGGGVSGPGETYVAQDSQGVARSLTLTGVTQLDLNTSQQGIVFNVTGSGGFSNNSGVDLFAYESAGNCGVNNNTYNTTSLSNDGLGLTAISNGVVADGMAANISGGNANLSTQNQLDGEVLAIGGWGTGDGYVATHGNASSGGGGAQVNLGTYSSTTAQSVGPAAVFMNAVTTINGSAS